MSDTPQPLETLADEEQPIDGPPPDDNLPGMKLGDYVVQKAVAWGGMGIVYSAVHPLIGRKVAVKVLRPNYAADPEQTGRFLMEAKAISAIKHRGIIDIISFGNLEDGRQYMVMEFLEGEPLEAVMQRENPMSPARALAIVEEIVDALSAAHSVGVVHRDLKPSNVYITEQSNGSRYVKLVDFGLARRAPLADLERIGQKASVMAGTPEYLSPEQVKGLTATPRTDLYCLGVMLFEMVTGQLPFQGTMMELLHAHLSKVPRRARELVSSLPVPLDDLIAQLLEKSAEDRPSSASEVRQLVQRMIRQLKEDSTHVGPTPGRNLRIGAVPPSVELTSLVTPAPRPSPRRDTDRTHDDDVPTTDPAVNQTARMNTIPEVELRRPTQRTPAQGIPRWVWPIALVALVGVGGAIRALTTPVPVVPPPTVVEAPALPPNAVVTLPVLSPQDDELVKLSPKPPKPVPVVVAPPKPPRPIVKPTAKADLPEICYATNWKTTLQASIESAEQQVLMAHRPVPDALEGLRKKLERPSPDCGAIAAALQAWTLEWKKTQSK